MVDGQLLEIRPCKAPHPFASPPGCLWVIRPSWPPVGAPSSPVFERIERAHRALSEVWVRTRGRCFARHWPARSSACLAGSRRPASGDAPAGEGWCAAGASAWLEAPGRPAPGGECDNARSRPILCFTTNQLAEQLVPLARRAIAWRHG